MQKPNIQEKFDLIQKIAAWSMLVLCLLFLRLNSPVSAQTNKPNEPVRINAFKRLDGSLTAVPFTFELKDLSGRVLLTEENNTQGLITFDLTEIPTLRFLTGDEYLFTISEKIPEDDTTYRYDSAVYRVSFRVHEPPYNNLIEIFNEAGLKIDELIFENCTNQPPEPVTPTPIVFYPILPETGFSARHAQPLPEKPLDLNYRRTGWLLQIPRLSLAANLVTVPVDPGSGRYDVAWLGENVGLLDGYALPGEGTAIVTGHNHLNTTEAGPFALLRDLKLGDTVFLSSPDGEFRIYTVYANEKIAEDDFAALEKITGAYDPSITFITCEDERTGGGYANRRIVSARPVR
ncbi:MAG: sortase [Anaerolineaceae bacterium]|nr:sortase [Anaerolineaceae bacterium]